jgi:hypothetical protein
LSFPSFEYRSKTALSCGRKPGGLFKSDGTCT